MRLMSRQEIQCALRTGPVGPAGPCIPFTSLPALPGAAFTLLSVPDVDGADEEAAGQVMAQQTDTQGQISSVARDGTTAVAEYPGGELPQMSSQACPYCMCFLSFVALPLLTGDA